LVPRLPFRYVVLFFVLLLSACSEPVQVTMPPVTAADVVEGSGQLERFATNLDSDQRRTLADASVPLTLFAPVNRAFDSLDSRTLSRPVMDYHLLSGRKFLPTDLRLYAGDTLPGSSVRVVEQGGTLALQGAGNPEPITIITVDTRAMGSAIYLIDGVLLPATPAPNPPTPDEPPSEPSPEPPDESTLVSALRTIGADVFADALQATELDARLSTAAATLFVPEGEALSAALAGLSSDERQALLERHLILGSQLSGFELESFAIANNPLPVTLSGHTWQVGQVGTVQDTLVLEGYATILQSDMDVNADVGNITIHLIDTPLQESPPQTGTRAIVGTVFADHDGNGEQDAGETGLAGVTVRAFVDSNGNGVRDGSEVQHHTVSDAQGRYELTGLDAQPYQLVQDLPFGWRDSTQALQTQVVGGGDAPAGAYPFVVSLQFARGQFARGNDFVHYCGASLISERWLLTAAHCAPRTDEVAYLGASQLLPMDNPNTGIRVAFERVISHPRFRTERSGFDVALVRLARPINLPTVSLASVEPTNRDAYVVGWGDMASGAKVYNDSLQDVDVALLADATCWQLYQDNAPTLADDISNRDTQRCAGRILGGVDACQGDSGGPLLVRSSRGWVQVGISSWGLGCAFAGFPGVYSNVPALYDWITEQAVEPAIMHVVNLADTAADSNTVTFNFANTSTLNPYRDDGFTAVRDFATNPIFPEMTTGDVTFRWQVNADASGARCELDVDDDGQAERVLEPCSGNPSFTYTYARPGLYRAVLRVHDGDITHTRKLLVNASQPAAISLGERLTGELQSGDSTSFARQQTFSDYLVLDTADLSAGVRVVLTSNAFEPVLYLLDGNWRTLASSLDGTPEDNHAEITLPSPLPDRLIIAVTSDQAGAIGDYQLVTARD
jgi:secreted trypsin-like serine protease/uncharacterized surface protein with fasciclin (FAS1) repeats